MKTGLDCLLEAPQVLAEFPYGLLSHTPARSRQGDPAHLALVRSGVPPRCLFAPEHGLDGVEQDMVPAGSGIDPWTGLEVVSLYGSTATSLVPEPRHFEGLERLLIDVQDIGTRYYTFATTACWAARAALELGLEVWVLDRPNPLGGVRVEGPGVEPGLRSFVGAWDLPVRHGLTLGELLRWVAKKEGWSAERLRVLPVVGWDRGSKWPEWGIPWSVPSPNMPSFETALLYPGLCLMEATTLSEGRGTTRPFRLLGAPGLDGRELAQKLTGLREWGVQAVPARFRPQFQKHAGNVCEGVELWILEPEKVEGLRVGVEILWALREWKGAVWGWRTEAYEFVNDRLAIDLLAGSPALRESLESGDRSRLDCWILSWESFEERFLKEREPALLYPEQDP
jgi:uncharacterized protein YbbC (DUF1343 family)